MTQKLEYLYIRTHPYGYGHNNQLCKLGKTNNIADRNGTYKTGEPDPGNFEMVFEVQEGQSSNLEILLLNHFWNDYHYYNDSATEFFDKKIMNLIEPFFIQHSVVYRKLSANELSEIKRKQRETAPKPLKPAITLEIKEWMQSLVSTATKNRTALTPEQEPQTFSLWKERAYQTEALNHLLHHLEKHNRVYLELPTGGGKSYIVFKTFDNLQPEKIVILSPRKVVNSQNISQKYTQLLKDDYETFDFSKEGDIIKFIRHTGRKIITCCTQSMNKLGDALMQYGITGITAWYDESHWGLESRVKNPSTEKENTHSKFWLLDEDHIERRIFTSASPNRGFVRDNADVFGEWYCPITVKELIQQGWLSPIRPFVYGEKVNAEVDTVKHLLTEFQEQSRTFGFSFHNSQQNARQLFNLHFEQYQTGNTTIQPFLLISDIQKLEDDNENENDDEPNKNTLLPSLDYAYTDISTFEQTPNSIAYVVAKYSMGYDFKGIDYARLSDPKMSPPDIIQCLGRGIRPDGLGIGGKNMNKYLVVSLPVFIDQENEGGKYKKTVEVLKYLLYDVGLSWDDFTFNNKASCSSAENGGEKRETADYFGGMDVKSVLLDLVQQDIERIGHSISIKQVQKILSQQTTPILSKRAYLELCKTDIRLPTDPEAVFGSKYPGLTDYLGVPRIYYNREECQKRVRELMVQNPEIQQGYLDLADISHAVSLLDPMFPADDLWTDYYRVVNLKELIDVAPKKKKTGIVL